MAVDRIQDSPTFRRFVVRTLHDELLIDLAVDSPPMGAPTITAFGPTYPPEELAARKLLALFDRAAARDFVDVHALSAWFDLDRLVEVAAQLDNGFDAEVLVEMLASLRRFTDEELADLGAEPTTLRAFIDRWRVDLSDDSR
jgi:predicted nucleotidyltransferase component of viral defense system